MPPRFNGVFTPKALHLKAQGREALRATLGYDVNTSVLPEGPRWGRAERQKPSWR